MNIKLTAKQTITLTDAYEATGYDNGYQALKAKLSQGNKAKLRDLCDKDGYISDRDLIYAIIDKVDSDSSGLDL